MRLTGWQPRRIKDVLGGHNTNNDTILTPN